MSGQEDAERTRRNYHAPYTAKHPIPTISEYREEKQAREDAAGVGDGADLEQSRTDRAKEGWRTYWRGDDKEDGNEEQGQEHDQPQDGQSQGRHAGMDIDGDGDVDEEDEKEAEAVVDTSEVTPVSQKGGKRGKNKQARAEREVTDPITHLPVKIYDFTEDSLKDVDENPLPFGRTTRTATGLSNKAKTDQELREETGEIAKGKESMSALFPPPSYEVVKQDMIKINNMGIAVGLSGAAIIVVFAILLERMITPQWLAHIFGVKEQSSWLFRFGTWPGLAALSATGIFFLISGVREWVTNRMKDEWEDQIWEGNLEAKRQEAKAHETESTMWLNQLVGSVWPLINPDLFTSLADMLEDVMQASLPRLVQMVSVDDIGQGSESLRILGIRWLPSGAAGRSVGNDGKVQSEKDSKKSNDRSVPGQGEVDQSAGQGDQKQQNGDQDQDQDQDQSDGGAEKAQVAEGMEAEEGDFINLEVAFAYRARKSESFKDRTKDMHLYLAFYLPGGLKLPIWVDVKGVVGTCRMRLQLAPDPPFFALCTLTFLGQPKVDISCIPLFKRALNIMDLPLISKFVQSSVDAAMAEYVAPKSLTLDLKDMLAGDDFKKDTVARGILVVDIIHGYDFKEGDTKIPMISDGSSDPYVSVGWAKFGKPMFSTRVLISEQEPFWHERAVLLVTPEELNVDERLRLQLWDSDRFTADDDLGRIEVDLKQIMTSDDTNGKMHYRTDGFRALKAGENMPGKLEWRVGYFSKARLQACQFQKQTYDKEIRSEQDLEEKVKATCERKLREASIKKGRHGRDMGELEQQKKQERKATEDAIIICAPPPDGYPSGVFSIQIHQITGLELERLSKPETDNRDDEAEEGGDMPSAYCNIIINHRKVFKTRTKPKNSKPFYNAGTERFIPDWHNAEVYVAVRDAREGENDPLLGIVHLPLGEVFKDRAQINGYYPIMGGIGYGRIRISMVWRSVQLQAPPEQLGWECGTLEAKPVIDSTQCRIPSDLSDLTMKFHTSIGNAKMWPHKSDQNWRTRRGRSLFLPVQKRYASCLAIRFKRHGLIKDKTAAFAILWLKDIPDEEEKTLTLPIYKGDYDRASTCTLDANDTGEKSSPGEKVGHLTLTLTFWSGLGRAHSNWASKDPDLKNVMEVLDVAHDSYESKKTEEMVGITDGDGNNTDSSSDSDSDYDSSDDDRSGGKPPQADGGADGTVAKQGDDGKRNIIDKAKDYSHHAKQQHRRNRGAMQFKVRLFR